MPWLKAFLAALPGGVLILHRFAWRRCMAISPLAGDPRQFLLSDGRGFPLGVWHFQAFGSSRPDLSGLADPSGPAQPTEHTGVVVSAGDVTHCFVRVPSTWSAEVYTAVTGRAESVQEAFGQASPFERGRLFRVERVWGGALHLREGASAKNLSSGKLYSPPGGAG